MALSPALPARAQGFRVQGRVLRVTGDDSVPLPARWVVLHEVGLTQAGPVDSQRTDGRGAYTLRSPALDTAANYLVSVEYQDVGYFSEPFRPARSSADSLGTLLVYDTSATAPEITLAERHVLVRTPDTDGSRRVVELFVLANAGHRTRIAPDTLHPIWRTVLPGGVTGFEVGMSDLGSDGVLHYGDTIAVVAPLPPGERQLLVSYLLPSRVSELVVRLDQPVRRLSLLLQDPSAEPVGTLLAARGVDELDGAPVRRYGAESVPAGETARILFAPGPRAGSLVGWVVVPVAALVLGAALVYWWRRRRIPGPIDDDATALAAEIAALDREFVDRADDTYRRRRAELKARLAAALARAGTGG